MSKSIYEMTVAELRKVAKDNGVKGYSRMTKAELINNVTAVKAEEEDTTMPNANANLVAQELVNRGYDAQVNIVNKNGVELTGITIKEPDINIAPTIYIDEMEGTPTEIADRVLARYEQAKPNESMDIEWFSDWDKVKEKGLSLFICGKEIPNILMRPLLDMYVGVAIKAMEMPDGSVGSIKVRPEFLQQWGISEDELFNAVPKADYVCKSMIEMMMGLGVDPQFLPDITELNDDMYVITNKEKVNGATIFAYPEDFSMLAEKFGDDLWIIPSSIHEVIVVPQRMMDATNLTAMIREVNADVVSPYEVLSDHPYSFTRETGEIAVA